jgi:hypothetical protein
MKTNKSSSSKTLPIIFAIIGLTSLAITTYLLLKNVQEEDENEDVDVENYEMKNVPIL